MNKWVAGAFIVWIIGVIWFVWNLIDAPVNDDKRYDDED